MMDFIKNRIKEVSTMNGVGILIACLLVIAFGGLAKIIAYVGVAYALWQIFKKD
tara:strand:+ start:274 stop:435 length:162 start_codon:yes stop_codon:yes gene_type:complete